MIRLIASTVVELIANAFGMIVALWLLPGFSMNLPSFIIVVAIFTVTRFVLAPLIFKLSFRYARVLTGGIALVTTFVGLFVTTFLTNGIVISGLSTWVLATLIIWICGVIAMLVLPLVIFKKVLAAKSDSGPTLPNMR